jgi:hypothetical protein
MSDHSNPYSAICPLVLIIVLLNCPESKFGLLFDKNMFYLICFGISLLHFEINHIILSVLRKRGHLHSDTGYVYYSEKYEGILFFVLLGLIVLAIWSFISMII